MWLATEVVAPTAEIYVWPGWHTFSDWHGGYVFKHKTNAYVLQGHIESSNSMGTEYKVRFPVLEEHFGHLDAFDLDDAWMKKYGNRGPTPPPGKIVMTARRLYVCLERHFDSEDEEEPPDEDLADISNDPLPRGGQVKILSKTEDSEYLEEHTGPKALNLDVPKPDAASKKKNSDSAAKKPTKKRTKQVRLEKPPRGGQVGEPESTDEEGPLPLETELEDDEASEEDPTEFIAGQGDAPPPIPFVQSPGKRKTLKDWEGMSDVDVFFRLAGPMLLHTLRCTNTAIREAEPDSPIITEQQFMSFIGFKIFTGIFHLPNIKYYFYPDVLAEAGVSFPDFSTRLSYNLYLKIVKYLRFEDYYLHDEKDKDIAWKVRTITNMTKKAFMETDEKPSRNLTIDEGMGKCEVGRNPIFRHVPNKPVDEGFKWYMLVDSETKLCINFLLEDGTDYSKETNHYPGGKKGQVTWELIKHMEGNGYYIFFDNWYTSARLADFLRRRGFGCTGTATKDQVTPSIKFDGQKPKHSAANPKGTLRYAHRRDNLVHQYAWMDTGACYFMDTIWGGKTMLGIQRKSKSKKGAIEEFLVPKAIHEYNVRMGGADTNNFHSMGYYAIERERRGTKWTHRYFECLLSRFLAQAFIIGNVVNERSRDRFPFQIGIYKSLFSGAYAGKDLRSQQTAPGRSHFSHVLMQTPKGSRDETCIEETRRCRLKCVCCPSMINGRRNRSSDTDWFCRTCCVPLCPSHEAAFHAQRDTTYKYVVANSKLQQFAYQDA